MRTSILFGILLINFIGIKVFGQSNAIDRYYSQYLQDDRFTEVSVSSKMFDLFVNFEMDDPDEQELINTISKLNGLKVLIGESIDEAPQLYNQLIKSPSPSMEELMSVKDEDANMRFFISESNNKISELLMIVGSKNGIVLLSLTGDIDLKQIAKLSEKMNISGFEHLKNIK